MADFVKGLFVKAPHPNAPDFVKCKLSIKVSDMIPTLNEVEGDWLNLDVKVSREGKYYAQVDDWKPEGKQASKAPAKDDFEDEIPFN